MKTMKKNRYVVRRCGPFFWGVYDKEKGRFVERGESKFQCNSIRDRKNRENESRALLPVRSINDLAQRCRNGLPDAKRYKALAICAAENLGGNKRDTDSLDAAIRWLEINAMETDEQGVIEEVNFCRDLI